MQSRRGGITKSNPVRDEIFIVITQHRIPNPFRDDILVFKLIDTPQNFKIKNPDQLFGVFCVLILEGDVEAFFIYQLLVLKLLFPNASILN